jgi:hypothetical protein
MKTMKRLMLAGGVLLLAGLAMGQTTAPATKPAAPISVDAALSRIPATLQPTEKETGARAIARNDWVAANLKGTTVHFKVTVNHVQNNKTTGQAELTSDYAPVKWFGVNAKMQIVAAFNKEHLSEIAGVEKGSVVDVAGSVESMNLPAGSVKIWRIRLSEAFVNP